MQGSGPKWLRMGPLPILAVLLAAAGIWAGLAEHSGGGFWPSSDADRAGAAYRADLDSYSQQVALLVAQHQGGSVADLRDVVDQVIAQFPPAPAVPDGATNSKPYQAAVMAAATERAALSRLRTELAVASQAEVFVSRANDALKRAMTALLGSALVYDPGPLQRRTLPTLRDVLADVRALSVPAKGKAAAQAVDAAIVRAIREIETMIAKLDAGGSYSFNVTNQFDAAQQQLKDYSIDVDGDVREAIAGLRDAE